VWDIDLKCDKMNKTNLQIIFEDAKMFVCNKPIGVLAQSGKSFDVDMVSALMTYKKMKGEDTFVGVINRLDRQVGGLMVFAKTKEQAAILNKLMQQNEFNKHYYAVVCGKLDEDKGTFVDYLLKNGKTNTSTVVSNDIKDSKRAELEYEVIKSIIDENTGKHLTLVKIHLITGRHHQIRIQFATRGLALAGDNKYGDSCNMSINSSNGIGLFAYSLQIGKQKFEIKPEDSIFKLFE